MDGNRLSILKPPRSFDEEERTDTTFFLKKRVSFSKRKLKEFDAEQNTAWDSYEEDVTMTHHSEDLICPDKEQVALNISSKNWTIHNVQSENAMAAVDMEDDSLFAPKNSQARFIDDLSKSINISDPLFLNESGMFTNAVHFMENFNENAARKIPFNNKSDQENDPELIQKLGLGQVVHDQPKIWKNDQPRIRKTVFQEIKETVIVKKIVEESPLVNFNQTSAMEMTCVGDDNKNPKKHNQTKFDESMELTGIDDMTKMNGKFNQTKFLDSMDLTNIDEDSLNQMKNETKLTKIMDLTTINEETSNKTKYNASMDITEKSNFNVSITAPLSRDQLPKSIFDVVKSNVCQTNVIGNADDKENEPFKRPIALDGKKSILLENHDLITFDGSHLNAMDNYPPSKINDTLIPIENLPKSIFDAVGNNANVEIRLKSTEQYDESMELTGIPSIPQVDVLPKSIFDVIPNAQKHESVDDKENQFVYSTEPEKPGQSVVIINNETVDFVRDFNQTDMYTEIDYATLIPPRVDDTLARNLSKIERDKTFDDEMTDKVIDSKCNEKPHDLTQTVKITDGNVLSSVITIEDDTLDKHVGRLTFGIDRKRIDCPGISRDVIVIDDNTMDRTNCLFNKKSLDLLETCETGNIHESEEFDGNVIMEKTVPEEVGVSMKRELTTKLVEEIVTQTTNLTNISNAINLTDRNLITEEDPRGEIGVSMKYSQRDVSPKQVEEIVKQTHTSINPTNRKSLIQMTQSDLPDTIFDDIDWIKNSGNVLTDVESPLVADNSSIYELDVGGRVILEKIDGGKIVTGKIQQVNDLEDGKMNVGIVREQFKNDDRGTVGKCKNDYEYNPNVNEKPVKLITEPCVVRKRTQNDNQIEKAKKSKIHSEPAKTPTSILTILKKSFRNTSKDKHAIKLYKQTSDESILHVNNLTRVTIHNHDVYVTRDYKREMETRRAHENTHVSSVQEAIVEMKRNYHGFDASHLYTCTWRLWIFNRAAEIILAMDGDEIESIHVKPYTERYSCVARLLAFMLEMKLRRMDFSAFTCQSDVIDLIRGVYEHVDCVRAFDREMMAFWDENDVCLVEERSLWVTFCLHNRVSLRVMVNLADWERFTKESVQIVITYSPMQRLPQLKHLETAIVRLLERQHEEHDTFFYRFVNTIRAVFMSIRW